MRISPKYTQIGAVAILGTATVLTIAILIFIIIFVLQKGLPILSFDFLFTSPSDMGRSGGILPILIGTILLPLVAIIIAAPLGIGTSIYLVEFTNESRATRLIRFGTDCLAGVPSIIFGLFGFIFFVTILGMGWSIMSGGLSLAFMILPTIIRTSEEAIRSGDITKRFAWNCNRSCIGNWALNRRDRCSNFYSRFFASDSYFII
jgi:phosphate transport system permease protein